MIDPAPQLLVVDDDPGMLALIERFATGEGFDIITRTGGPELPRELPVLSPNAALLDRNMPEPGGLQLLKLISKSVPHCQVILMTAEATVESAIEAVKRGALDYLSKPLDFNRLRELLGGVKYGIARRQRLLAADREVAQRFEFYGMVGRGPVMQELFDLVRRLAPHARTALISGETGTGKKLVARALHTLGPRKDRKFIAFNCSALVETLAESELFGHVRGAFTGAIDSKAGLFEQADGATLSSTRSASCRCQTRRSCCGSLSMATCSGLATPTPGGWTCESSRQRIACCRRRCRPAGSVRIFTTGTTSSRSRWRRFGNGATTFRI